MQLRRLGAQGAIHCAVPPLIRNPAALVHGMEEPVERCHRVAGQFHGSHLVAGSFGMPVGRAAVVCDPFGNTLVLVDLSKGTYTNSLA